LLYIADNNNFSTKQSDIPESWVSFILGLKHGRLDFEGWNSFFLAQQANGGSKSQNLW
jgi:hypothetical protein